MAPSSTVTNGISIANGTVVGIGSIVSRSISKPNQTYMGNPAIEISKYVKLRNKLNNLIDDTE
jgi:acetyltransferase-like isoleucine patch superfamily enzyme